MNKREQCNNQKKTRSMLGLGLFTFNLLVDFVAIDPSTVVLKKLSV